MNRNKSPVHIKEKFLIIGILILALLLRLPLINRGLFFDEIWVAFTRLQHKNFIEIFKTFWITNHIGYTILSYFFYHLFGYADWSIRIPALFFGMASIALLWFWTREYFGRSIALLAALLLSLSPAHIIFSVSARGYSALIFFALLSNLFYFKILENPTKKYFWGFIITNTIGLSFHMFLLAVLASQLLHLIFISFLPLPKSIARKSFTSVWKALLLILVISSIIYIPLIASSWGHITHDYHDQLNPYFHFYLFYELLSTSLWPFDFKTVFLLLLGLILSHNPLIQYWRLYLSILCLLPFIIWMAHPPFLFPRFFIYLLPYWLLLIALCFVNCIKQTKNIFRFLITLTVSCLLGILLWTWFQKSQEIFASYTGPYREAFNYAIKNSSPETRFCAIGGFGSTFFYQYYSDRHLELLDEMDKFKSFSEKGDFVCFVETEFLTKDKEKLIFLVLSKYGVKKTFGNTFVFTLK